MSTSEVLHVNTPEGPGYDVLVGRGRDYNDVPPLRGVYAGPVKGELHVRVTITSEA